MDTYPKHSLPQTFGNTHGVCHTNKVTEIETDCYRKKKKKANLGPHCWSPLLTSGWNNAEGHSPWGPCKLSARSCFAMQVRGNMVSIVLKQVITSA